MKCTAQPNTLTIIIVPGQMIRNVRMAFGWDVVAVPLHIHGTIAAHHPTAGIKEQTATAARHWRAHTLHRPIPLVLLAYRRDVSRDKHGRGAVGGRRGLRRRLLSNNRSVPWNHRGVGGNYCRRSSSGGRCCLLICQQLGYRFSGRWCAGRNLRKLGHHSRRRRQPLTFREFPGLQEQQEQAEHWHRRALDSPADRGSSGGPENRHVWQGVFRILLIRVCSSRESLCERILLLFYNFTGHDKGLLWLGGDTRLCGNSASYAVNIWTPFLLLPLEEE